MRAASTFTAKAMHHLKCFSSGAFYIPLLGSFLLPVFPLPDSNPENGSNLRSYMHCVGLQV